LGDIGTTGCTRQTNRAPAEDLLAGNSYINSRRWPGLSLAAAAVVTAFILPLALVCSIATISPPAMAANVAPPCGPRDGDWNVWLEGLWCVDQSGTWRVEVLGADRIRSVADGKERTQEEWVVSSAGVGKFRIVNQTQNLVYRCLSENSWVLIPDADTPPTARRGTFTWCSDKLRKPNQPVEPSGTPSNVTVPTITPPSPPNRSNQPQDRPNHPVEPSGTSNIDTIPTSTLPSTPGGSATTNSQDFVHGARQYGFLGPIVGIAGLLLGAGGALLFGFTRKLDVWKPPADVLPDPLSKMITMLCAVAIFLAWILAKPTNRSAYISSVLWLVGIAVAAFLLYVVLRNTCGRFRRPLVQNNEPAGEEVIWGGFWTTKLAKEAIKKGSTAEEVLAGNQYNKTKVWPGLSLAAAAAVTALILLLALVCSTAAISTAATAAQVALTNKPAVEVFSTRDVPGLSETTHDVR
jgi:hypothetical protein